METELDAYIILLRYCGVCVSSFMMRVEAMRILKDQSLKNNVENNFGYSPLALGLSNLNQCDSCEQTLKLGHFSNTNIVAFHVYITKTIQPPQVKKISVLTLGPFIIKLIYRFFFFLIFITRSLFTLFRCFKVHSSTCTKW